MENWPSRLLLWPKVQAYIWKGRLYQPVHDGSEWSVRLLLFVIFKFNEGAGRRPYIMCDAQGIGQLYMYCISIIVFYQYKQFDFI